MHLFQLLQFGAEIDFQFFQHRCFARLATAETVLVFVLPRSSFFFQIERMFFLQIVPQLHQRFVANVFQIFCFTT